MGQVCEFLTVSISIKKEEDIYMLDTLTVHTDNISNGEIAYGYPINIPRLNRVCKSKFFANANYL